MISSVLSAGMIIAYLIWKGSYNIKQRYSFNN